MEKTNSLFKELECSNVFFAEASMYLIHPIIRKLVEVLPRVGNLKAITTDYFCNISKFTNGLGKGSLYNVGYYQISLIELIVRSLFGNDGVNNFLLNGFGRKGIGKDESNIVDASCTHFLPKLWCICY